MNKKPKLSIVTPSYNQGDFLEETIDSVLSQGYTNLEYIIIDGNSDDNSVEIIKKYQKYLTHWISEKDNGQAHALNKGFAHATGDIYAYINSDDVYFPGTFSKVSTLFKVGHTKLIYSDIANLYEGDRIVVKPKISFDFRVCLNAFMQIPQPASFWCGSRHRQISGFDESLHYCPDYDFFLRLSSGLNPSKMEVVHVKDVWAKFRLHKESKTVSNPQGFSDETKRLRKKFNFISNPFIRPIIKNYYLAKALYTFYIERGYVPLSKDTK